MKKIFLFVLFILTFPAGSLAADANIKNTIQIAPLKYEEKLNLGDVKDGVIDVMNPTANDETISIETSSLKMGGLNGQLVFYKNTDQNSFEKFVTFSENKFVLPAGTGKKVKFRLGIPISASPGGYFGAVFFRLVPNNTATMETRAIATGEAGTLFILSVGQGDIRSGKLDAFRAVNSPFSQNVDFEIEQSNLAKYNSDPRGTYLKPTGMVKVKNIFGQEKSKQEINGYYVLPETKRIIKKSMESPYLFGVYKAELSISNYPGDPVITKSVYFVRFSPTVLALIAIFALVIFVILSYVKPKILKTRRKK